VDGDGHLRIAVLGPIRVVDPEGRDCTPDGVLQRRLLALLVLHRGRVVSADAAIDVLWPSRLPRDPVGALQNHVSRLRRLLPGPVIESVGDGYRLDPAPVEVDCDRLRAAVSRGARDGAALVDVEAVLEQWTGRAYPELDDVDAARAEAARLDELRIRAREVRAEGHLARGETDGAVADLTALAGEEPLRERPRALLMAALATTGRRAEALRVYDDFRRRLGDELGIEPSPALVDQHAAILAGEGDAPTGPATSDPAATRLPVPPTSLVGREALVDEVTSVVGASRLVTLVGPGGVGKTRLLLEVGRRLGAARPDRAVVWCELAAADEASATGAIAAALGVDARPGVPLVDRVTSVLAHAEVVVLADNCEHVLVPVAALVEQLLARCPNVTVVASSRERLRIAGEQVCAVPPLPVDGNDGDPAAVRLFVERARAVSAGFAPSADDLACVAEIVRRLDGLPLAIELAAARLYTHDVGAVAAGLDRRFSLLSSGYRTATRHGSLSAAVSWSFELLDEKLRNVFAALSVFAGPFSVDDAAAVCSLDPPDADAALVELTERSLVMRAPGRGLVLLETLRAFGTDQLVAVGQVDLVHERHATHFTAWVERASARMLDPETTAVSEVEAAIPELRAALSWLVDHHRAEEAGRLVFGLLSYGILRLRPDVLAWASRVRAIDPDGRSPLAARVLVAEAYATWMSGDVGGATALAARALAVAERAGGPLPAETLTINGTCALVEGRLHDALGWYERAIEAAAEDRSWRLFASSTSLLARGYAGDPTGPERAAALLAEIAGDVNPQAAYAWYCAGEAMLAIDPELARTRFTTALELADSTGASFVTGVAGASRASLDARLGDPVDAAAEYRWLIDHWRRAGMWSTQWTMLRSIAGLLARLGKHEDAAVLLGAVRATTSGHRIFGADDAALTDLDRMLQEALGAEAHATARARGAVLDGDAAVEHALRALSS
jgi:predicted ATPase/DNA-binding SARP family transcriptional activator